jgi:hypothetical protein
MGRVALPYEHPSMPELEHYKGYPDGAQSEGQGRRDVAPSTSIPTPVLIPPICLLDNRKRATFQRS